MASVDTVSMFISYDYSRVSSKSISGMNLFIKVVWEGLSYEEKECLKKGEDLSSMMNSVSISTKKECKGPFRLSSVFSNLGELAQDVWNDKALQISEYTEEDSLPSWNSSKLPIDIALPKYTSKDFSTESTRRPLRILWSLRY